MALERTFFIIKPDAVAAGNTGNILALIEKEGFSIAALHRVQLTRAQAEGFYAVHSQRGFFGELCDFMTRGPVVIGALQKEEGVAAWRTLMGATDPAKADAGTMRKLFGANVGENATHGSDSLENAKIELSFFFAGHDVNPSA